MNFKGGRGAKSHAYNNGCQEKKGANKKGVKKRVLKKMRQENKGPIRDRKKGDEKTNDYNYKSSISKLRYLKIV